MMSRTSSTHDTLFLPVVLTETYISVMSEAKNTWYGIVYHVQPDTVVNMLQSSI